MYHCLSTNRSKYLSFVRSMSKQKKGKAVSAQPVSSQSVESPVTLDKIGNIKIKIAAKPGAKINAITGIDVEGVGVQISAPPVEGEANIELVKYLASCLGVKKSCVCLDRGSKSRQKTIILSDCNLTVENVIRKLKENIGS